MPATVSSHLRLALPALLLGATLVGCQAERPILAPAAPVWSYHDGNDQFSNNDAWEQMIPSTATLPFENSKLASVEESTAE